MRLFLIAAVGCGLLAFRLIHPAHRYDVHGIDISHHQRYIDWERFSTYNAGKYSFIFIKATEGATHKDSRFSHYWEKASEAGLHRGAYHFYTLQSTAYAQAKHFIKQVKLDHGDLPPVLDFEVDPTGIKSLTQVRKDVLSWLNLVEKQYGIKPVIYTNLGLYTKVFKGHFGAYQFWLADYNPNQPKIHVAGEQVRFWQYTEKGRVTGIGGNVDLNVFLGDYPELACITLNKE